MSTFNDEVRDELGWLDGTIESAVMSMTGYTKEQIDSLGGINEVMLDEMVTTCRSIDDLMERMSTAGDKSAESAVEELFPEDVLRNLKDKRYRAMWELDKPAGME